MEFDLDFLRYFYLTILIKNSLCHNTKTWFFFLLLFNFRYCYCVIVSKTNLLRGFCVDQKSCSYWTLSSRVNCIISLLCSLDFPQKLYTTKTRQMADHLKKFNKNRKFKMLLNCAVIKVVSIANPKI